MKWDNALPPVPSRVFRDSRPVPKDGPDLWWLAFKRRNAFSVAAPTRLLAKAVARGFRSTVKLELDCVRSASRQSER